MGRSLNRIAPALPVEAVQTYQAVAISDETVVAACATVGCKAWRYGWDTMVDEATELGQRQAHYIRTQSGRTFTEVSVAPLDDSDRAVIFRFDPYQRCFADHQTRPARYLVRRGDWRSNLGVTREHTDVGYWVEDFAEHQEDLAERINRG